PVRNPLRPPSHFRYWASSSGLAAIGSRRGARLSASPRGTGTSMQNGSPFSNRTHSHTRVIFQFIVNVEATQSVSTTPSRGCTPSFTQLVGPLTHRLTPGGVRNRNGTVNV